MRIKLTEQAKNTPGFQIPTKQKKGDAGYDMYLMEDVTFLPGETVKVNMGVCFETPEGWAGRITLRSSTSLYGLVMQDPLIDSNYRGAVHAIVLNTSNKPVTFKKGERLCSVFFFPVYDEPLEVVDELSETERSEQGFGSSGR